VPAFALLLAGSMTGKTLAHIGARTHDPRRAATRWVLAHVLPGRTLLVEHAAVDLLADPGCLLFPLGKAGCIDVRAAIKRAPSHARVNQARTVARSSTWANDAAALASFSRFRHHGSARQ
jgi:hypothetical protein